MTGLQNETKSENIAINCKIPALLHQIGEAGIFNDHEGTLNTFAVCDVMHRPVTDTNDGKNQLNSVYFFSPHPSHP
jgi:hypothetical protein